VVRDKQARVAVCAVSLVLLAATITACGTTQKDTTGSPDSVAAVSSEGIDASSCPPAATQQIMGDTITLGTTSPLSGTYASVGLGTKAVQAEIDQVNARGGVSTVDGKKKIKLVSLDDQFQPSKVQTNTRQMVEQDHVAAVIDVAGTANALAIAPYLSQKCVPEMFPQAGAASLLSSKYPFTTMTTTYLDEGKVIGKYLKAKYPNAKVAVLIQNDDTGTDSFGGVQSEIEGSGVHVVKKLSYEVTDSDVTSQMTTLEATRADVFLDFAFSVKCTQSLKDMDSSSWRPTIFTVGFCGGQDVMQAGVPDVTKHVYTPDFFKGNASTYGNDEDFKAYATAAQDAGLQLGNQSAVPWINLELVLAAISSAKTLSSVGIAQAARSLPADTEIGMLLPGIKVSSAPGQAAIRSFRIDNYDPSINAFADSSEEPLTAGT